MLVIRLSAWLAGEDAREGWSAERAELLAQAEQLRSRMVQERRQSAGLLDAAQAEGLATVRREKRRCVQCCQS